MRSGQTLTPFLFHLAQHRPVGFQVRMLHLFFQGHYPV